MGKFISFFYDPTKSDKVQTLTRFTQEVNNAEVHNNAYNLLCRTSMSALEIFYGIFLI